MKPQIAFFGIGCFFAGLTFGGLFFVGERVADIQRGYTDGRQSILEKKVTVGTPGTPCSVEVPMGVLAEMVTAGVTDWAAKCEEVAND